MALVSEVTTAQPSGQNHIDSLLDSGPGWNWLAPARNVLYYSFSVASGNEVGNSSISGAVTAFNATQQSACLSQLAYVSQLTGITFAAATSGTTADLHFASVDIVSNANTTGLCSWGSSYSFNGSNTVTSYSASAYVYLDNVEWLASNLAPATGNDGYETLLHEIGHALGLKHPFDGTPTLPSAEDKTSNTVMSYTNSGGPYSVFSPYDEAALLWIYGDDGLGGSLGFATPGKYIVGNTSANAISGGSSSDKLYGGNGNDALNGGSGSDIFKVWDAPFDTSTDTIADFTPGIGGDSLTLPIAQFTNFTVGANPFTTGHARLTQSGANTLLELDIDGTGAGTFQTAMILNSVTKTSLVASNLGGFAPTVSTHSLAASAISVNEGANATFTLTTTNVANGTILSYVLSGTINAADVSGGSLTGNLTVNNNTATITVGLLADASTEGAEILTASVTGTTASVSIGVADTSTEPAPTISTPTKSKIYMGAGSDSFAIASSGAVVIGNTGSDAITIASGITGIKTDANIERMGLTGNLANYKFGVAPGTGIQIQTTAGVVIGTLPSLNQTTTVVFADGSAPLEQTGGSAFSLSGLAISTSTPAGVAATLNTADKFTPLASSVLTKAKIYMGAGGDSFAIASSGASVIGNTGTDAITIAAGLTGIKTDANIERLELSLSLSGYKFGVVAGTGIQIQTSAGVVVATLPSLNQTTTLAFADGSAPLVQTGGSAFSLGGLAISTTTAAAIAASLNTADKSSVAVTTGPVAVTISGAGTSTDGGAAVATTYSIGAGTYTHTINGFGAGDILKLFSGAALTVMPDSNDADGIQSLTLADAATGATTTITLTGLTSAQDAGLFNLGSFNTVFGAGTIL